jgi:hypothetical protein
VITGWLVKLVVAIALVGFLVVELGTPLVVRLQLDGTAHDAADSAEAIMRDRGSFDAAKQAAVEVATGESASVDEFSLDEEGHVRVTLHKEAKSYLLKRWGRLKSWYDVRVSAAGEGRR